MGCTSVMAIFQKIPLTYLPGDILKGEQCFGDNFPAVLIGICVKNYLDFETAI